MIGAVTSNRSSRANRVPHANTSAATMARSDSLTVSPAASPGLRDQQGGEHKPPR